MLLLHENSNVKLNIGVLGLGKSNLGVLEYLYRRGLRFNLTVRDSGKASPPDLPFGISASRVFTGEHCFDKIDEDFLFLSPSARWDAEPLLKARRRGVILSSDANLFFSQNRATRVYAVTGTDGKSTTVKMLTELLRINEPRAECCGNIGRAISPLLLDGLPAIAMELSSFQLMNLSPRTEAALITNITENHLDWHRDFDEYVTAKERIFLNAKWRAACADDGVSLSLAKKHGANALFSLTKSDRELSRLGAELRLTLDGDFILRNGMPVLNRNYINGGGIYGCLNFMGAMSMLKEAPNGEELIRAARAFTPLPHRAQRLGRFGGVEFISSSIDSTPMRSRATLLSLPERPIIILGGRGKRLSFAPLVEILGERTRGAVIIGECRDEIISAIRKSGLDNAGYPFFEAKCLDDAVPLAAKLAGEGGCVLLSPAATSYDAFSDYSHRGREFERLARLFGGQW